MGNSKNDAGITVVIPHYGDPSLAQNLIRDLRSQRVAPFEMIVVDDFSPTPFPQESGVRMIRLAQNSGFGSAVNAGARIARGELLLVLNSDLKVDPDFIENLTRDFLKLGSAILSPIINFENGRSQFEGRKWPTNFQYFVEWLTPLARFRNRRFWHRLVGHESVRKHAIWQVDWVAGAAMLLRLSDFKKVNGFDERFFMYCEEVDLQRRLFKNGVKAYVTQNVKAFHELGASTPSEKRRYWLVQSRFRYQEKWTGSYATLKNVLILASILNFLFNVMRSLTNTEVQPLSILKRELSYISQGIN